MAAGSPDCQRGVAMITALLLTTLAVTIVASLFWRQQVQVRGMENQRLQLQANWVLHGTLDRARRILLEDARASSADHLDEAWNSALAKTSLEGYLGQDGASAADLAASVEGQISDAQARFNLAGLAANGVPDPVQVAVLRRLLALLRIDPRLAGAAAERVAEAQARTMARDAEASPEHPAPVIVGAERAPIARMEDLLAVEGYTSDAVAALGEVAVVLPAPTTVNINTAGPEVLAAVLGRTLEEAKPIIAARKSAWFKDGADVENRLNSPGKSTLFGVDSSYFLVRATVRIGLASREQQALVYRKRTGSTTLVWVK